MSISKYLVCSRQEVPRGERAPRRKSESNKRYFSVRSVANSACVATLLALSTLVTAPAVQAEPEEQAQAFRFRVERFEANPIIHREMHGMIGEVGNNINGPSLIRVPEWVENPLGKYYLYFSHHHGDHIRLAYADALEGPWIIHQPGVLHLEQTPGYEGRPRDHVASPDVHVDHEERRIRMYFHQPNPTDGPRGQGSYLALSEDGLNFEAREEYLGWFYFRVIEHDGWHYAFAKFGNDGGILYRSRDGLSDFEEGPKILPRVRHMALWKHDGNLYVFYTRGFDAPEHILVSRVTNLDDDWHDWEYSEPQSVLRPELDFEGVDSPIEESTWGATYDFDHSLRDPAIYEEDGRVFMVYSAAGEWSLAIAEIFFEED